MYSQIFGACNRVWTDVLKQSPRHDHLWSLSQAPPSVTAAMGAEEDEPEPPSQDEDQDEDMNDSQEQEKDIDALLDEILADGDDNDSEAAAAMLLHDLEGGGELPSNVIPESPLPYLEMEIPEQESQPLHPESRPHEPQSPDVIELFEDDCDDNVTKKGVPADRPVARPLVNPKALDFDPVEDDECVITSALPNPSGGSLPSSSSSSMTSKRQALESLLMRMQEQLAKMETDDVPARFCPQIVQHFLQVNPL